MTIYHEKEWRYLVNQVFSEADITALGRAVLLAWKNDAFLSQGSWVNKDGNPASAPVPYIVRGSGNSVTAGMDDIDRWVVPADIVFAATTSPHSWIVVEHPNGTQICIDVNSTVIATSLRIMISPSAGFTGGTATARPTATDEWPYASAPSTWGISSTNVVNVINWRRTVDGLLDVMTIHRNGWTCCIHMYGDIAEPVAGLTNPFIMGREAVGLAVPTAAQMSYNWWNTTIIIDGFGASQMDIAMTQAATAAGGKPGQLAALQRPNVFSGKWPLWPCGLISIQTNNSGALGHMPDIFGGILQVPGEGGASADYHYYGAASGSHEWVHAGPMVMSWPSSVSVNYGSGSAYYLGEAEIAASQPMSSPVVYQMQAWDSVTEDQYTWLSFSAPDFDAFGYPGPNSATNVSISSVRHIS